VQPGCRLRAKTPSRGVNMGRAFGWLACAGKVGTVGVVAGMLALGGAAGPGLAAGESANKAAAGVPLVAAPLRVVVTIPPLKGLVEGMLPAGSTVTTLIPPGASEHGYDIPPARLAEMARADLVVMVGLGLEPQVEKQLAGAKGSGGGQGGRQVVVLADAAGVKALATDHSAHSHDEHGNCVMPENAGGTAADPHVWLDPGLVAAALPSLEAAVVAAAGGKAMAAGADDAARHALAESIRASGAKVKARVAEVDAGYRAMLEGARTRTLVVGHDAWGHLARRYGLRTVAIKGLNAGEPTPAAIAAASAAVKAEGLSTVFVEPQLSPAAGKRIASATGAKVATLDPLGSGDWFAMMEANRRAIAAAVGGKIDVSATEGGRTEQR